MAEFDRTQSTGNLFAEDNSRPFLHHWSAAYPKKCKGAHYRKHSTRRFRHGGDKADIVKRGAQLRFRAGEHGRCDAKVA
jgi:hypothetical protein